MCTHTYHCVCTVTVYAHILHKARAVLYEHTCRVSRACVCCVGLQGVAVCWTKHVGAPMRRGHTCEQSTKESSFPPKSPLDREYGA